jgi:hypothetical protein
MVSLAFFSFRFSVFRFFFVFFGLLPGVRASFSGLLQGICDHILEHGRRNDHLDVFGIEQLNPSDLGQQDLSLNHRFSMTLY